MTRGAVYPLTYSDWKVDSGGLDSLYAATRRETHRIMDTEITEGDKIDTIAAIQGQHATFEEPSITIDNYMVHALDLEQTVKALALPIEHLYTSGDEGRLFYESERTARSQRPHLSPEDAEISWGLPQHYAEPEVIANPHPLDEPSTEGLLWRLWASILHIARKTPWRDAAAQGRLLTLVRALKSRPNPPQPMDMTTAMRNDWIWRSGPNLWSSMCIFGPSAREEWNNEPNNPHFACTPSEVRSWENVNAFVARLSAEDVRDFFLYGLWALRDILENEQRRGQWGRSDEEMIDVGTPAAVAWIKVAGREIWAKCTRHGGGDEVVAVVDLQTPAEKLPWGALKGTDGFTVARWRFWKGRFAQLAGQASLAPETREIAGECARLMENIEETNE